MWAFYPQTSSTCFVNLQFCCLALKTNKIWTFKAKLAFKANSFPGPKSYRDFRETGPRLLKWDSGGNFDNHTRYFYMGEPLGIVTASSPNPWFLHLAFRGIVVLIFSSSVYDTLRYFRPFLWSKLSYATRNCTTLASFKKNIRKQSLTKLGDKACPDSCFLCST